MGLFNWFTQEIAIDLGTANTLIIHNDEVVVNEPSIVALNRNNPKEVLAVGKRALMMHEKTHESIRTVRPLKDGVIADFNAAELMIRELIKLVYPKKPLFPPSWRMMICIPSSITEVEKRAVRDSAEQAGAKEVYLLHEPMAAALGIGIDVEEPVGNMIIDIGGGTTGITVIALAGIVCDQSIRIAGDEFTADIMEALRRYHSLLIGERTAEQIKIQVGAAMKDLENPPEDIPVNGRDLVTGIPKQIMVSFQEIAAAQAALFILLYRGYPMLELPFQLLNTLLEIDEQLSSWRYRHMNMVHRMIGMRIGTGGSTGKDYLKAAADKHYIFKEIAQLNSFLIERRKLPALPAPIEQRLGFVTFPNNY